MEGLGEPRVEGLGEPRGCVGVLNFKGTSCCFHSSCLTEGKIMNVWFHHTENVTFAGP